MPESASFTSRGSGTRSVNCLFLSGSGSSRSGTGAGTTARDSGPSGRTLTLNEGTGWSAGFGGSALKFDGQGHFAQADGPVIDTTTSYSVSAWATLDSLPGSYATVVSQDGRRQENPFYLQYGQGAFAFSTSGGNRAHYVTTPELGRWYHLVDIRDAERNEIRLYVDGVLASTAVAGPADVSTGPCAVGRAKWGGGNVDFWKGSADGVHAFDKALSSEEVAALHAAEKP